MKKQTVFYLISGAIAGFVNGFFGAGGGMVLVPLLIVLAKMEDKNAFSSAICIILPFCLVSIFTYTKSGSIPLLDAIPYFVGGAAGGVIAGLTFRKVSTRMLHLILGGVILLGGVKLLLC